MDVQDDSTTICWRLHLKSSPTAVYEVLSTDEGRARFWAESAVETGGVIHFIFPNHQSWRGRIIEAIAPYRFRVEYISGSVTTFDLSEDGTGGTDLTLTDRGVEPADRTEVAAGWVSVLLALKAAVDFGVDLRNHNLQRTWSDGFVDN